MVRVEIQFLHGHLKIDDFSWERGKVIGRVPDQDRLPQVQVTDIGIGRASGGTGAGSGTLLWRGGGGQNFPRLVYELEGGVSWTLDSLK